MAVVCFWLLDIAYGGSSACGGAYVRVGAWQGIIQRTDSPRAVPSLPSAPGATSLGEEYRHKAVEK